MPETVHLIVNPSARRGRGPGEATSAVRAVLADAGHDVRIVRPASVVAVPHELRAARDEGMTRLITIGGDGLVHQVLPEIVGTDVVLGLVPVGTGNDFARALGLPTDPRIAARAALDAPQPVDLLRVGHRFVATVVAGGFAADVSARSERLAMPGAGRYTVATLAELPTMSARPLRLEVDGVEHRLEASLVVVANTRFFGAGMDICPDATPDDGEAEILVVDRVSRLRLARFFPKVFSGGHLTLPEVHRYRGRRMQVEIPGGLWGDGEPLGHVSDLEVVPGAVRVAGALVEPR